MTTQRRIQLGDKVRDKITGIVGIAIVRSEFLYGCVRFAVQPQELKDGAPLKEIGADEGQLDLVEAGVIKGWGVQNPPEERAAPAGDREDHFGRREGVSRG